MPYRTRLLLILLPCLLLTLVACPGAQRHEEPVSSPSAKTPPAGGSESTPQLPLAGQGEGEQPAAEQPAAQPLADWPQPQVVLFFTGRQHGYIEPCGCTGLANQKGGLNRRYSFLEQLRTQGWNVVPLDMGNQVRRFGPQAEIKFHSTIEALRQMEYAALALGPDDLQLSVGELVAAAIGGGQEESEFIGANVSLLGLTPKMKIIESGGLKIGVTAVLGDEYRQGIRGDEIENSPAAEALPAVVEELQDAECDLLVLLAHATIAESRELARQNPEFNIVVTAGGAGEPTWRPERIEGSPAQLIQVGVKGMYVSVLGIYDDAEQPFRFERVDLDARFPDARAMLDLMGGYQNQLEELGLEGLSVSPRPHPSGLQFVGSETCADCHTSAWAVFEETPHAWATDSIAEPTERSEIPRHFDPECLSCHVTGWDPQGYFPYVGGYLSLDETLHLSHNGCENCHGPGSAHVAAEMGEIDVSEEEQLALQVGMRLTLEEAEETCLKCHDLDNSPDFHEPGAFDEYWEEVEHHGKD